MHALALYLCDIASEEEQDKLTVLYNNYLNIMMHVAQKYVGKYQAEEDVVHNAILKIIANLEKIDLTQKMQTKNFVCLVTKHCAIDWLRKRQREVCASLDEIPPLLESDERPPLDYVTTEEGYAKLIGCIHRLNGTYREVCDLKFVSGYRDKEIAEILGIPENTVGVRIHRGRKLLIAMLKEEMEDEESVHGADDL